MATNKVLQDSFQMWGLKTSGRREDLLRRFEKLQSCMKSRRRLLSSTLVSRQIRPAVEAVWRDGDQAHSVFAYRSPVGDHQEFMWIHKKRKSKFVHLVPAESVRISSEATSTAGERERPKKKPKKER